MSNSVEYILLGDIGATNARFAAPLSAIANQEKLLPPEFISADGFGITESALRYLASLIVGEAYPPFKNGLPDYVRLQNVATAKKLTRKFAV